MYFMCSNINYKNFQKNPVYGRHWLSRRVRIIALCQKTLKQNLGLICNTSPQVQSGTPPCFQGSTRGRSTSPIRNTSWFLRVTCDIRANERPWKKIHGEGTYIYINTYIHTWTLRLLDRTGPEGRVGENSSGVVTQFHCPIRFSN